MKVEIINTGTELFLDELTNLNLTYLANQLIKIGWEPVYHTTVPDNLDYLISSLHTALKRARLVIITGGLGSTSDDLTRFAVAVTTRRELKFNHTAYQSITRYFRRLKRPVPPLVRVQAEIPQGARPVPNRLGTAPGFWLKDNNKIIIALPGVPEELKDICHNSLIKPLARLAHQPASLISAKFLIFGLTEIKLQKWLNTLGLPPEVTLSITAANNGVLSLRLIVKAQNRARSEELLKRAESLVKADLDKFIFGMDYDTLGEVVARMLLERDCTIAVAESCTGGLLSHRLSNIPGISRVFKEGVVSYSNESKTRRLNISPRIIRKYGAVSPEVARLMARNITRTSGTELGVGITGIAGPTGDTKTKPIGLVYIALHSAKDHLIDDVVKYQFTGNRLMIKELAVANALNLIRLRLLEGLCRR